LLQPREKESAVRRDAIDLTEQRFEEADLLERLAGRIGQGGRQLAGRTRRSVRAKSGRVARAACRDMTAYARRGLQDPA
jgi:hypothetical protein